MFWFILAILLVMVGIGGIAIAVMAKNDNVPKDEKVPRGIFASVGSLILVTGLVAAFLDCTTTVPVRSVGVQTSFGKPIGVLSNGFHWIRPWSSVETFDGTVQTATSNPVVRLKNGTTATVDVSVQWQIDTGADFLSLYKQYKSFDNIQTNVIQRQLANALNEVFETFDPLASIDASGNLTVQVTALATQVQADLSSAVPPGLIIRNVTIPVINYSPQVEAQINTIIAAAAQTRVAQQQEKTNQAISQANAALKSGDLSLQVLYQNCLNLTQQALSHQWALPPGWTCGSPGASVVIPTK